MALYSDSHIGERETKKRERGGREGGSQPRETEQRKREEQATKARTADGGRLAGERGRKRGKTRAGPKKRRREGRRERRRGREEGKGAQKGECPKTQTRNTKNPSKHATTESKLSPQKNLGKFQPTQKQTSLDKNPISSCEKSRSIEGH